MIVYLQIGNEYSVHLAEWLVETKNIEHCYLDYYEAYNYLDESALSERISTIPMGKLLEQDCFSHIDINSYPALEYDDMKELMPFESMALKLVMRETNYPIGEYEYAKRKYYNYARYWKYILKKNKIDCILFEETPHDICKFVLYAVAKCCGINTLLMTFTGIRGQMVYGDSIETIGDDIGRDYKDRLKANDSKIILTGAVKDYYERSLKRQNEAVASQATKKKWADTVYDLEYRKYDISHPQIWILYLKIRKFAKAILKQRACRSCQKDTIPAWMEKNYYLAYLCKKYDLVSLKEYDKKAVLPDYSEKYVYFPLQQTPELTIMPLAGNFAEQYNSIQLLAQILEPFDIRVYVKEYYIQYYREKRFWEEIKTLKNVKFIKSMVSSADLIEHSIAVASQTGTVILEGVFENKPAFVFGDGYYWKEMPGVYPIRTIEEGRGIVGQILEGEIRIEKNELLRYFGCIEKNSVNYYVDELSYQVKDYGEKFQNTLESLKMLLERKFNL